MAQVNVTLKDAKMPKVHMVQHTSKRYAFCILELPEESFNNQMDHPVLIFHQAATAEPKLGICRCWCLLNLENTAYLRQKQVFSPYASFTNMLNNWVGTLAPLTFHDFWSLFNLWCSNTLFWSADVLLGQSSAQKGTKRYTHEQTESRKRTSTKLTINFFGFHRVGFSPSPSHPHIRERGSPFRD